MASLQSNIEHLSNKIQDTFHNEKETMAVKSEKESSLGKENDILKEQYMTVLHQQDYDDNENTTDYSNLLQENTKPEEQNYSECEQSQLPTSLQEYGHPHPNINSEENCAENQNLDPYTA